MRALFLPPTYQDSAESGRLILRDGSTAFIRPSEPGDRDAMREFFHQLSPQSKRRRFFSIADPAEALLERQCDSSNPRRAAHADREPPRRRRAPDHRDRRVCRARRDQRRGRVRGRRHLSATGPGRSPPGTPRDPGGPQRLRPLLGHDARREPADARDVPPVRSLAPQESRRRLRRDRLLRRARARTASFTPRCATASSRRLRSIPFSGRGRSPSSAPPATPRASDIGSSTRCSGADSKDRSSR